MKLDFTTLYVVILLNSVGFAIVWAMVSLSYRTVTAARYWFAALLLTCLSGPFLVLGEESRLLTYAGILLTVASFALIWQGIRVLDKRRARWRGTVVILLASAASMAVAGSSREADNIIFATSQMVPVLLAIAALLTFRTRSLGVCVAIAAGVLFILGQGAEAVTNALHLAGAMTTDEYYAVAVWFLVCAIMGASILNLGLLLIVTDRLRAELYSLATRDDLTGLPNRRALRARIAFMEKSAARRNRNVVIMMVDLDQFKAINDQYGHDAGDAALVHVAGTLRSFLRDGDFLARVGGDEFCLLLPDTRPEEAAARVRSLGEAFAERMMHWHGERIAVPGSIGFVEWRPGSGISLSESLPLADNEMFDTKRSARREDAAHRDRNGLKIA